MTHGSINVNRYKCCGFLFDSGFKLKEKILKNGISKEANTFFNTLESFFIFVNFIYTIVLLATFTDNAVIQSIRSNMFNQRPGTGYGFATAMAWVYFLVIMALIGIVALIFRPSKISKKKGAK